jgi:uncharacterized protein
MTREEALKIVTDNTQNINLVRHMLAVEMVMKALYKRLTDKSSYHEAEEDKWGIVGLLHDADYETIKENPQKHTQKTIEWLKEHDHDLDSDIENAILSHAWGFVEGAPEPKNSLEWSLYCCDELTGFIVAVALVKPDRKLSSVTVDSVLNKWGEKGFARGVHREQIENCEARLGIPLREFVEIALTAMQADSIELGL